MKKMRNHQQRCVWSHTLAFFGLTMPSQHPDYRAIYDLVPEPVPANATWLRQSTVQVAEAGGVSGLRVLLRAIRLYGGEQTSIDGKALSMLNFALAQARQEPILMVERVFMSPYWHKQFPAGSPIRRHCDDMADLSVLCWLTLVGASWTGVTGNFRLPEKAWEFIKENARDSRACKTACVS